MMADLGLRDQKPKAVVQNIVGFTDCVASENINHSLRQERAVAILSEFIFSGALAQNLPSESNVRGANASGEADQLPGTDSTIEGKTKNRSVLK